MDKLHIYEIRVEGHLTDHWDDWFDGFTIHLEENAETTLTGNVIDQAALLGVLTKIHNLNLVLISVYRKSSPNNSCIAQNQHNHTLHS